MAGDWIKMRSVLFAAHIREMAIRFLMALHVGGYRVQRWSGAAHKRLVFGRSAAQVECMEEKRGLR